MGKKKIYANVTRENFACMKGAARSRIKLFAQNNDYKIVKWVFPEGDRARFQVKLKSNNRRKADMDFTINVVRNKNNQLSIELVNMPLFIPYFRAVKQVDNIYKSCVKNN